MQAATQGCWWGVRALLGARGSVSRAQQLHQGTCDLAFASLLRPVSSDLHAVPSVLLPFVTSDDPGSAYSEDLRTLPWSDGLTPQSSDFLSETLWIQQLTTPTVISHLNPGTRLLVSALPHILFATHESKRSLHNTNYCVILEPSDGLPHIWREVDIASRRPHLLALSSSLLLSVVSQPPQTHSLSGPYTGSSLCFQHSSFRSSQSCFLFVIQIFIKVSAFQRGHLKYQIKAVSKILSFSTVDSSALHDLLFLFEYLFLSFLKIGLVGRTLACD